MAENNEVIVNENGQVEDDGKLTTGEKVFLGGSVVGIGALGYLLGTYVIAPAIKKVKKHTETAYEQAVRESKKRKNRKARVPYDEDGDYRDVKPEDDEEDDD